MADCAKAAASATVYPALPLVEFAPLDPSRTLSPLCDQVFVSQRDKVPKISILTVSCAADEPLQHLLAVLQRHQAYPHVEWLVADMHGGVQLEPCAPPSQGAVKVLRCAVAAGVAGALNTLYAAACGDYILLLGPHCVPHIFSLYQLMGRLKHHAEVAAVGGLLRGEDGRIVHAGVVFDEGNALPLDQARLSAYAADFADYNRNMQAVSGHHLLVRRADLDAVQGFAQNPILSQHECGMDLCLRLRSLRKKVVFAAAASATMYGPIAAAASPPRFLQAESDAHVYRRDPKHGQRLPVLSVVSCINNDAQYASHVLGSLLNNYTDKEYEIIPILNPTNQYTASSALNEGIRRSKASVVILCHQDVIYFKAWIETLFVRLEALGERSWCVLGTAGIREDGITAGAVQRLDGTFDWNTKYKNPVMEVQTVDEHCMVYNKHSGVLFDEKTIDGFHFYGPDICLEARSRHIKIYGIYNPLVHNGSGGSLLSGEKEYRRLLERLVHKWGRRFSMIRTPTCIIVDGKPRTYLRF